MMLGKYYTAHRNSSHYYIGVVPGTWQYLETLGQVISLICISTLIKMIAGFLNDIVIKLNFLDTGKSVVCIQKAINTSEEDLEAGTYFISMVATDKFGAPAKHSYLFDLTTKRKLQKNPRLKFITTSDLLTFYY